MRSQLRDAERKHHFANQPCCRRPVGPDTPARTTLFNDIATFVYERLASADGQDEPASKRRRVDIAQIPTHPQSNGHAQSRVPPAGSKAGALSADAAVADPVLLEVKDISVTAPQRKKYDLCFTKDFLYARASGTSVPVQGVVYPWKDIGAFMPAWFSLAKFPRRC